jgi:hypothetical protein
LDQHRFICADFIGFPKPMLETYRQAVVGDIAQSGDAGGRSPEKNVTGPAAVNPVIIVTVSIRDDCEFSYETHVL